MVIAAGGTGEYGASQGSSNIAGKELKSTSGWDSGESGGDGNGTDKYGFNALPSGRYFEGQSYDLGKIARWWTDTEAETDNTLAYIRGVSNQINYVSESRVAKSNIEVSVRCIADD